MELLGVGIVVWIGLGALVCIGIIALNLLTRREQSIPVDPLLLESERKKLTEPVRDEEPDAVEPRDPTPSPTTSTQTSPTSNEVNLREQSVLTHHHH